MPNDKRRLQAELRRRLWRELELTVARRSESGYWRAAPSKRMYATGE